MDQLLAMKVFVQVADRGSFAQAANELDISRAATSGHVAALERHLGVRLFNRTTRKVSLTAEGADFLRRSRRILDELHDAEETLRGARLKPRGRLRVDVPVAFGRHLLLPALPEFSRRYPEIELDIRLNDRVVDLVAERVDVALRVVPVRQSGFVVRRVSQFNFVTIASPKYLAEHGDPATPDDLQHHRLLGLTPANGGTPEWHFPPPYTSRRLKLHFATTFNAIEGPITVAAAGLGIARTIDVMASDLVARGELKLILQDYTVPGPVMSLVYPSAGHQSAKVRVFSEFAVDLMRRWSEVVAGQLSGVIPSPPGSRDLASRMSKR